MKVLFHYTANKEIPMQEIYKQDLGGHHSNPKIIYCIGGTTWFVYWDYNDKVWRNINSSDKVYVNQDYVLGYLDIPSKKDITSLIDK